MRKDEPLATGLYEAVQREDDRWVVVYGPDLPQAGMQWEGTEDYATEREAIDSITGNGRPNSFSRFMLDQEPPPVEWDDAAKKEGMLFKKKPKSNAPIVIILMLDGMLMQGGKTTNGRTINA